MALQRDQHLVTNHAKTSTVCQSHLESAVFDEGSGYPKGTKEGKGPKGQGSGGLSCW